MSNRLKGFLRLSAIPKNLVQTTKSGVKGVYISVSELREKGKFGETHTITIWDKDAKKAVFICNLKPDDWEDRKGAENSRTENSRVENSRTENSRTDEGDDDLPF